MLGKQPIFTIFAELEGITGLGRTPYGERRVIAILGGSVRGPKLNGRILPGGAEALEAVDGPLAAAAEDQAVRAGAALVVAVADGAAAGLRRGDELGHHDVLLRGGARRGWRA